MKLSEKAAATEAILFAMGDSVRIGALASALECTEQEAESAAAELAEHYEETGSALVLNRYEDAVQLSTREFYYPWLVRIAKAPKKLTLSDTLMETLSIIAFRQPVTRLAVENIRGVNSDFAINRLVSFDLV